MSWSRSGRRTSSIIISSGVWPRIFRHPYKHMGAIQSAEKLLNCCNETKATRTSLLHVFSFLYFGGVFVTATKTMNHSVWCYSTAFWMDFPRLASKYKGLSHPLMCFKGKQSNMLGISFTASAADSKPLQLLQLVVITPIISPSPKRQWRPGFQLTKH